MKLLHTGDLHLGKSLHESSLLDDQKAMLDRLSDELGRDDYAALVIAGDVYDRNIPASLAIELFSDFLVTVRTEHPDIEICIIPGNHDSAQRLSFADSILRKQHIHIISYPEDSFEPIIVSRNGERIAIFLLPFLAAGSLATSSVTAGSLAAGDIPSGDTGQRADEPLLVSQADLALEASGRFSRVLDRSDMQGIPTVLAAHLFILSGRESGSERVFLGEAEQVSASLFSRFNYVALGHLHRNQKITDRMYYSGSPLAYSFDEAGSAKYFLKVDIDCASAGFPVTVTPVAVVPKRAVSRLSGAFTDFYTGTMHDAHAADYLEICLTDDDLVANPVNLLKGKFPYLLSVRQGLDATASERQSASITLDADGEPIVTGERSDPLADFRRFEAMLYGDVAEDRVDLFSSLLSECADEA
jgi:exonuclease SbcD